MTYTARTTAKTVIVVRNTAAVEVRTTLPHFDPTVRCPGAPCTSSVTLQAGRINVQFAVDLFGLAPRPPTHGRLPRGFHASICVSGLTAASAGSPGRRRPS